MYISTRLAQMRYLPLLHPALYTFLYKASSVTSAVCLSSASLVSRGRVSRERENSFSGRLLAYVFAIALPYCSSLVRQQACLPHPGPGEATGLAQRQVCIVFSWCHMVWKLSEGKDSENWTGGGWMGGGENSPDYSRRMGGAEEAGGIPVLYRKFLPSPHLERKWGERKG